MDYLYGGELFMLTLVENDFCFLIWHLSKKGLVNLHLGTIATNSTLISFDRLKMQFAFKRKKIALGYTLDSGNLLKESEICDLLYTET